MVVSSNYFWRAVLSGNDVIYAPTSYAATMFGDFLVSTGNVTAGNDSISGAGPNQKLIGDADTTGRGIFQGGDDIIVSNAIRGSATIIGDVDKTYLSDLVCGNDKLAGSDTRGDLIIGDINKLGSEATCGDDIINGRGGNDTLIGDVATFRFATGGMEDEYKVIFGDDVINGGAGNDTIVGDGFGRADSIGGNDTIDGGTGNDTIKGGKGADTFIFRPVANADTITDFEDNIDTLRISASYGFADADAVAAATTANGNDAVIHLSATDTITLTGFLAAHTINDLKDDIVIF